jgi:hypothetical protein
VPFALVLSAIITLGFYIIFVFTHVRPMCFLCWRSSLFSRREARVVDNDEYQARICADDEDEEDEEKDQKRDGGP